MLFCSTKIKILNISSFTARSFRGKTTDNNLVEAYFSGTLTISDLATLQADLAKKEIKLNYDFLVFNKDGKLKKIEYHVWFKKVGRSYKSLDTHTVSGLVINTDPHAKFGIIVGTKEQIEKGKAFFEANNNQNDDE